MKPGGETMAWLISIEEKRPKMTSKHRKQPKVAAENWRPSMAKRKYQWHGNGESI
jgi:hypothetical protein